GGVLDNVVPKLGLDANLAQRPQAAVIMPDCLNPRIADDHRSPRAQLGGQFAKRIDLIRTEDDARAGLEVEWRHSGVRSAEFGVRSEAVLVTSGWGVSPVGARF